MHLRLPAIPLIPRGALCCSMQGSRGWLWRRQVYLVVVVDLEGFCWQLEIALALLLLLLQLLLLLFVLPVQEL